MSGTGIDVIPNLQKCPVPVFDVVPNLPKCPVPVIPAVRFGTYRTEHTLLCMLFKRQPADYRLIEKNRESFLELEKDK